jgi:hypothetical protein
MYVHKIMPLYVHKNDSLVCMYIKLCPCMYIKMMILYVHKNDTFERKHLNPVKLGSML